MNIRRIYNPRHVYEGWFESYFIKPWIDDYFNFSEGESISAAVKSILAWIVVTLGVSGILMGLVGLAGPETGFVCMKVGVSIWLVLSVIPFLALIKRCINGDAPESGHRKLLAIDALFFSACILFFVFGLLMMITTLNSEILHPDPGTDETETVKIDTDTVVEEPIFTYQNPRVEEPVIDTLEELTEPDMVSADESFDPSLETDADVDAPVPPDSIYF